MGRLSDNTIKILYNYGKQVYLGELKENDAAIIVNQNCPEVAISSAKHYILWYSKMRTGEFLTWNSNSKLLLYYVEQIFLEEGYQAGKMAAEAAKKFAAHVGRKDLETAVNSVILKNDDKMNVLGNIWWPSQEEYPLDLTKDDWKKYILEVELPDHSLPMKMLKGMMLLGGEASCKQLADTYGGHPNSYAGCAMNLGRRVKNYFKLSPCMDGEKERYFPFPFVGKYRGGNGDNYLYRIRPELFDALKEIDLSSIDPYYEKSVKKMSIKETIQQINTYIASKGYTFDEGLIANFYLSLKSKPFVILAGISGTGKSKLVRLFAEACGATTENGQFRLLPVKPDWSDASELLGYVNLEGQFKAGEVLTFIHEASKPENVDKPYFLCLDEMNLARVEYYFSDFLSVIETREMKNDGKIVTDSLISKSFCEQHAGVIGQYAGLTIPENLYVIGTVNMDETTFPFSRKVLDRANTIEFSSVNLIPSFAEEQEVSAEPISNSVLKTEYLQIPKDKELQPQIIKFCEELQKFNLILEGCNAQVAYRVRDEAVAYLLVNQREKLINENAAMDNIIMQKLLPRLQGSSGVLKRALCEMFIYCADKFEGSDDVLRGDIAEKMNKVLSTENKYPHSAKKIYDMIRRFEEDGFTSFWS